MLPIIERIVRKITHSGWIGMSIIAAYDCWPPACCEDYNPDTGERKVLRSTFDFNNASSYAVRSKTLNPSCVRAARGYQADHYVFEIGRPHSYMITLPLVRGAATGGNSTVHQEQVELHAPAFRSIVKMQQQMQHGEIRLPSFAKTCIEMPTRLLPDT